MLVSRVLSRVSRSVCRRSLLLAAPAKRQVPILSKEFHSLLYESPTKSIATEIPLLHHSTLNSSTFQRLGIASSASPERNEKDAGSAAENNGTEPRNASGEDGDKEDSGGTKVTAQAKESGSDSESQPSMSQSVKRSRRGTKRIAFSDSDSESDNELSKDDLVKLVVEKEELLKSKQKEIQQMQDKVLRTYAEMENVMDRTRREAENSKKFAIQNFAKSLLDVADNLGRASSVVKESFSKIDASNDTDGAAPLLKTLLEGVEMTEKQLAEVFKKYGVEKFNPLGEPFDPNKHNAVFQTADPSKPPGVVAVVLKSGYTLYDRVIRPAEVGVTQAVENEEADKGSEA